MAITNELREAVIAMQKGNAEGFTKIYEETHDYVYAKAKYIMKSEQDALDLTQETYIQAYKGLASLEDANNIYAWLGGIVYRQGMKIFNKQKEVLTGEEQDYIFEDIISEEATPDQVAEQNATVEIVKGMIDELPELQRVVVMAFYYDNMKLDDIAQMCECSTNTIKSRLNYAKKFLKAKVEEHEKQNRYKLCSLTPSILLLTFKGLLGEEAYKMPVQAVQNVFTSVCGSVGMQTATGIANVAGGIATGTAQTAGVVGGAVKVAGVAATATKIGLGAKIGIAIAVVALVGGAGGVVVHQMTKEPVAIVEEIPEQQEEMNVPKEEPLDEIPDNTETIEPIVEEEPEEEITTNPPLSMAGVYTCGKDTITITNAEIRDDNNAIFDAEIASESGEILKLTRVEKKDGVAQIRETSNQGNAWFGQLMFLPDGSIRLDVDITVDGATYTLGADGGLKIFTKAATEGKIKNIAPEEGRYYYFLGGSEDEWGCEIKIFDVTTGEDTSFVMSMELISAEQQMVDQVYMDMDYVFMNNGLATFSGQTVSGFPIYGYFYMNEDGSLTLSYLCNGDFEQIVWNGIYPSGTKEPVVLQKR